MIEAPKSSGISRAEWLAAVESLNAPDADDPSLLTLHEFRQVCGGLHRATATTKLRALVAAGKATVTRKRVRRSDGTVVSVPAYRLAPQGKSAKAR